MKRGRKIIRNLSIIAILLFLFCYFGGYFISKEKCIADSLRGLYRSEREIATEISYGNRSYTVVTDTKQKVYSIIGTKRIGFLYHVANSYTGHEIKEDECVNISGMYSSEMGSLIVVYRNDPRINRVNAYLENGSLVIFDNWENDFSAVILDGEEWYGGTYKAFDTSNQLIGEVHY